LPDLQSALLRLRWAGADAAGCHQYVYNKNNYLPRSMACSISGELQPLLRDRPQQKADLAFEKMRL